MPQLVAAVNRHHETGGNWATEGAILLACKAVWGDEDAQRTLDIAPEWRVNDAGEFA